MRALWAALPTRMMSPGSNQVAEDLLALEKSTLAGDSTAFKGAAARPASRTPASTYPLQVRQHLPLRLPLSAPILSCLTPSSLPRRPSTTTRPLATTPAAVATEVG